LTYGKNRKHSESSAGPSKREFSPRRFETNPTEK
jgi:hypothetical protein